MIWFDRVGLIWPRRWIELRVNWTFRIIHGFQVSAALNAKPKLMTSWRRKVWKSFKVWASICLSEFSNLAILWVEKGDAKDLGYKRTSDGLLVGWQRCRRYCMQRSRSHDWVYSSRHESAFLHQTECHPVEEMYDLSSYASYNSRRKHRCRTMAWDDHIDAKNVRPTSALEGSNSPVQQASGC